MKQQREIEMNPENIKGLQKAYDKAVAEKATEFSYQGAEFDTKYAYFLLEFYRQHPINKKNEK